MLIKDHTKLSDSELEAQFSTFKLKPSMFTHEAHIRLAYIHIKKYGVQQAQQNMIDQIRGYAASLNVPMKFNKTVTIASIQIMNSFMMKANGNSFTELLEEFPVLKEDFRSLVSKHYSFNVFSDLSAKKAFIEPDLLPF